MEFLKKWYKEDPEEVLLFAIGITAWILFAAYKLSGG